jgi:hypothetical protein
VIQLPRITTDPPTARMLKRLIAAAALVILSACDEPAAIDDYGPVLRADADAPTLTIRNLGGQSVHYAVFERVDEGTVFWGKCSPQNAGCPTLAPGETIRILYTEIAGYEPGDREAIVFWWTSEPDAEGGYRILREGDLVVRL